VFTLVSGPAALSLYQRRFGVRILQLN
jgi:hypothetical protein